MSIKHYMEALLGLLYPQERFCLCCREPMPEVPTRTQDVSYAPKRPHTEPHLPTFVEEINFCDRCRNAIRPIESPFCLLCGRHFDAAFLQSLDFPSDFALDFPPSRDLHAQSPTITRCPECERETSFVMSRSYGAYKGLLRDLLHRFKFSKEKDLIQLLGPMAAEAWNRHLAHFSTDVIVPVPAHPDRIKERGYNQAEILADYLADYTKIPCVPLLQRKLHLQGQAVRYREERLQALRNAYIIQSSYRNLAVGKRILLVDDIYTTGSTAEACAGSLREAGAAQVYVLTVAR